MKERVNISFSPLCFRLKQIQTSQLQLQDLIKQLCEHFHIDTVNPIGQESVVSDWTDITSRLDVP